MFVRDEHAVGTVGSRSGLTRRRLRPGKAVTTALAIMTLASGAALVSAAPALAEVCPVHGCYQIKETGQGPTPTAAEYAAETLMIAAGCHLIDVPVNVFQALPGGTWLDHAVGICLG
jgi:hypothetical protein